MGPPRCVHIQTAKQYDVIDRTYFTTGYEQDGISVHVIYYGSVLAIEARVLSKGTVLLNIILLSNRVNYRYKYGHPSFTTRTMIADSDRAILTKRRNLEYHSKFGLCFNISHSSWEVTPETKTNLDLIRTDSTANGDIQMGLEALAQRVGSVKHRILSTFTQRNVKFNAGLTDGFDTLVRFCVTPPHRQSLLTVEPPLDPP